MDTPHIAPTASPSTSVAAALIRLGRPKQWIKNVYLFAAIVFAGQLFTRSIIDVVLGTLCFCLASSSVYVLNDILDVERDRVHPKKRLRPIPSGAVGIRTAWTYFGVLLALWVPLAYLLNGRFALIAVGYFLMNVAYSVKLKHVFLLDVMIIAIGFVLRAVAGAVIIDVPISPWLFVCTILVSLFLALGKRRNEVTSAGTAHREVLQYYSVPFIDQLLSALSGTTILAYSLYTFHASDRHDMMWTIPFVIYGLFRYLYLVHGTDLSGAPEEALIADKPMLVNIMLWGCAVGFILYFR